MKWTRPSGSTIELKDTPEMEQYAISQGLKKAKRVAKKTKKAK